MKSGIAAGIMLLLLFASVAYATDTWTRTYGDGLDDSATDALLLADGGVLIVGETVVAYEPAMIRHLLLLRLDAEGRLLWTRTYGGDRSSAGHGLLAESDGGFIISGAIQSEDEDDSQAYLLRVDSDGNEIWSRTFGTPLNEFGARVVHSGSAGYWIVGNSVDPADVVADPSAAGYAGFAGRSNVYVVRTDVQGRQIWSRRMESAANTIAFGSAPAEDGGIVILSCVLHYPVDDNDILLAKLNAEGDEVWAKSWTAGNASGFGIIATSDGGYAISGLRSFPGDPPRSKADALLIKVDADGNETWSATYGNTNQIEIAYVITETTDGGYVCAGWQTPDLYTPGDDILLAAFDRSGTLQWEDLTASSAHNLYARILQHPDGSYVIVGSVGEPGRSFRIQLIKTDPPLD